MVDTTRLDGELTSWVVTPHPPLGGGETPKTPENRYFAIWSIWGANSPRIRKNRFLAIWGDPPGGDPRGRGRGPRGVYILEGI